MYRLFSFVFLFIFQEDRFHYKFSFMTIRKALTISQKKSNQKFVPGRDFADSGISRISRIFSFISACSLSSKVWRISFIISSGSRFLRWCCFNRAMISCSCSSKSPSQMSKMLDEEMALLQKRLHIPTLRSRILNETVRLPTRPDRLNLYEPPDFFWNVVP